MTNKYRLLSITALILFVSSPTHAAPTKQNDSHTPDELCQAVQENSSEPETRVFSEPGQVLEPDTDYRAIFCTEKGAVYVDLFERYTPVTVNNFVFLSQQAYYNNTTFHRVIEDFVAQGGAPAGVDGPGYEFDDEIIPFLLFERAGRLGMANNGSNTNGSQFFITRTPSPHLNGRHTIFGEVLEGQSVADALQNTTDDAVPDTLYTVLIITDPGAVRSSYQPPVLPTAMTIWNKVKAYPAIPGVHRTWGGIREMDNVIAYYESDPLAQVLFESHPFEFEVITFLEADNCTPASGLLTLGFSVIRFEEASDAAAFVNDPQLAAWLESQEFEPIDAPDQILTNYGFPTNLFFTRDIGEYCYSSAPQIRYIWNWEQYVLTVNITVHALSISEEQFPRLLVGAAGVLSYLIGDFILDSRYQE